MTLRRRLALIAWLATILSSGIAAVLVVATRDVPVPASWGFRGASVLFAVTAGFVGIVVSRRGPENRIGWIFTAIGIVFGLQALIEAYVVVAVLAIPGTLPGMPWVAWPLGWLWVPGLGLAVVFLPLLFPTGHLASERWKPVAWLGVVAVMLASAAMGLSPGPIQSATYVDNPLAVPGLEPQAAEILQGLGILPLLLATLLAIWSLVRRFRASHEEERRQIKWFALATSVAAATFAAYIAAYVVIGSPGLTRIAEALVIVALLGIPVAAGLAILRYRLYDIDRIISRTIAYGAVTGLLITTYALTILVLQGPLSSLTGNETVLVALSTLVVAALFQPLRRRTQTLVDRRFDRARYDAENTATAFAERLRDEVDIEAVTSDLDATVRTAIRPTRLGLWLRGAADQ